VTITKSISIVSGLGEAGVLVPSGGTGITISAGPNDKINLRGLIIEGAGSGNTGISFNSGRSLTIENCVVRNLTANGLAFYQVAPTSTVSLAVSNSFFAENGFNGILIQMNSAGAVAAVIDRVGFYDNGFSGLNVIGQFGTGTMNVTVTDSVAGNHASGTGFLVQSSAGQTDTFLLLVHSVTANNSIGASAFGANAELLLAQSTVMANATGYSGSSGGVIVSFGDNNIAINTSNTGGLIPFSKQ
jgi:hypothetical protein